MAFRLTQEALSDLIGLSGVHVNETVRRLRDLGLLRLEQGVAKLLDIKGLRQLAQAHSQGS